MLLYQVRYFYRFLCELQCQFLLDYFAAAPRDSEVVVSPIRFRLGALQLASGELAFADGQRRLAPDRFDPKHLRLSGLHFDLSQIYGSADSSSAKAGICDQRVSGCVSLRMPWATVV